tara:strand:+ start:113 stop:607 length:495 start_codon:yes stop_codon:yes gene_type:complete
MPGKHGMTKNKEGMPKNYKGMPKRTKAEAKAEAIEGGFDKAKAEEVFAKMKNGMPKNYNGMTKNFAMKNKMLSDSAKNGVPMQKNFLGKVGKAMMGPAGMLLTKKPLEAQAKSQIVDSKVSGSEQVANLTKHKPENSETNKDYQRALNLAKQREQSEKEDKKKA